jgi:hypothetical protein
MQCAWPKSTLARGSRQSNGGGIAGDSGVDGGAPRQPERAATRTVYALRNDRPPTPVGRNPAARTATELSLPRVLMTAA